MKEEYVRELTPEEIAAEEVETKRLASLEMQLSSRIPDNDPSNLWGEISVGKQTIKIYKHALEFPGSIHLSITTDTPEDRAKEILKQVGGSLRRVTNVSDDRTKAVSANIDYGAQLADEIMRMMAESIKRENSTRGLAL